MPVTKIDEVILTPEEISQEVRKFIHESVRKPNRTDIAEVTRGALVLLKHLPGSRDAVLEYICKIFFYACSRQMRNMEVCNGSNRKFQAQGWIRRKFLYGFHRSILEQRLEKSQLWM